MKFTDQGVSRMKKNSICQGLPFPLHTMHSLGLRVWSMKGTRIRRYFSSIFHVLRCFLRWRGTLNRAYQQFLTFQIACVNLPNNKLRQVKDLLFSETEQSSSSCHPYVLINVLLINGDGNCSVGKKTRSVPFSHLFIQYLTGVNSLCLIWFNTAFKVLVNL